MSLRPYRLDSLSTSPRMLLSWKSTDSTTAALRRLSSTPRGPNNPALFAHSVKRNSWIPSRHSSELLTLPTLRASESITMPLIHPPSSWNASETTPIAVPGSILAFHDLLQGSGRFVESNGVWRLDCISGGAVLLSACCLHTSHVYMDVASLRLARIAAQIAGQ
jgi:hypothetical protein